MTIVNQIPPSAIRSGLAIGTQFKDFRTGAPVLQQRLFVLGQGNSGVSLPSAKFLASSPGEVGALVGYGSPLHLMAKRIFPADGSGAASVECTFFALEDGTTAAVWTLDCVGTQGSSKDYQLRINDLYIPFTVPKDTTNDGVLQIIKDAIDGEISAPVNTSLAAGPATAGRMICETAGETDYSNWVPITDGSLKVTVDGGSEQDITGIDFTGDTDMDDVAATISAVVTGATVTWDTDHFVFTSDLTGEGKGVSVLSAGSAGTDISGASWCNGLTGTVIPGTDADNLLTLTAKWKGATSDELDFAILGTQDGLTYILEQTATGAGDPSIADAISALGNSIWYTMLCNQIATTTAFDLLVADNEARWTPLIHKPYISSSGGSDRSAAEIISDARKTDRTNFWVLADGCLAFSFEIAARGVAEMAARANATPHRPYTGLELTGMVPGADTSQPGYTAGDTSLKKGVSTTLIVDGVIELQDMVTFYHPDAEQPDPGYRYCCDIVKLQNIVNSVNQKFGSDDWKGKTILRDTDISTQPDVRRPKDAKGAIFGLADSWVNLAWVTDADFTKANLYLVKAAGVRNRFEGIIPVKISDSLRQQDYLINFGFDLA